MMIKITITATITITGPKNLFFTSNTPFLYLIYLHMYIRIALSLSIQLPMFVHKSNINIVRSVKNSSPYKIKEMVSDAEIGN